jgi:D-glycero-alpha-D-manno-heptose-7-phosphate kinase
MIISRTPFRVSFVGGGTDLPAFYTRQSGAVISMAVDRYVYINVNRRFDETLRLSYSKTEIVNTLGDVQHPLFREALRLTGASQGIEATSVADIPSGTGLGSSSSFAVGLLHALHAFQGRHKSSEELAAEACHLEIDILAEPIGKQDQYAAAYGGLRRYSFNSDETVSVDPVICTEQTKSELFAHLMFFYLGGNRDAREILHEQSRQISDKMEPLQRLRELVDRFQHVLVRGTGLQELGELLHENWIWKKGLAQNVSNERVDAFYDDARRAGVIGGKLLGAGQSGFLMLFCPPKRQPAVRSALKSLREVSLGFEAEGSKIIYVGR